MMVAAEFHARTKTFYDVRMVSYRQFCDPPSCPKPGKSP